MDNNKFDDVALVLQGGGALGSYQAGAYEALAEKGIVPTWVTGISIGALNAAIIAGNPPEKRAEKLHAFWEKICSPTNPFLSENFLNPLMFFMGNSGKKMINDMQANNTMMNGQKGFFSPKFLGLGALALSQYQTGSADNLSYYDTSKLKETLLEFADFDLINSGKTRVSVGAVNVKTGEFTYFDNTKEKLTPEHFMASGALPPGFPAIKIGEEYYWDGGIVNNSPIQDIIEQNKGKKTLAFQIDLWNPKGELPKSFDDISQRMKDIQFASRNGLVKKTIEADKEQAKILQELLKYVPEKARANNPLITQAEKLAKPTEVVLQHLICENKVYESASKDYQFSTATMHEHWVSGTHDMKIALNAPGFSEILNKLNQKDNQPTIGNDIDIVINDFKPSPNPDVATDLVKEKVSNNINNLRTQTQEKAQVIFPKFGKR
jgi:NTE family protein